MDRRHLDFERFFDVVAETDAAQAAEMTLAPGRSTGGPDNYHPDSDQWLFVHAGSGWAVVDGERYDLVEGDLVRIAATERHEIGAGEDGLATLNLYVPPRRDR